MWEGDDVKSYKASKGTGIYSIIQIIVLYDIVFGMMYHFINSYELLNLIKFAIVVFNVYELYYIIIYRTVSYSMDDENFYINSMFGLKNVKIPLSSILAYQKSNGHIKGVKLMGHGKNNFAIGRSFIYDVGTTNMFVTSNKNIIYLHTENENYGISPENFNDFEVKVKLKGIEHKSWKNSFANISVARDRKFVTIFLVASLVAIIITLNPIVIYLMGRIPDRMPLVFNSDFTPSLFGTARQFAFKQMSYGILNMAILFCMYYAGCLYGKYDKKLSYKLILISLAVAVVFLFMQIRIILNFR